jgi:hypothetical protein
MKPSDVFGIIVRTVGLVMTLTGLGMVGRVALELVGGGPDGPAGLFIGVPELLIGLWLLRRAESLVRFAYRAEG